MGFNPRFPDPFEDSVKRAQERVQGYKGIPQRSFFASVFIPIVALVQITFKAARYLAMRLWLAMTRR